MNPDSVSAQVPDIADRVSESTKASTTEVQVIKSKKKTNAQRCREYRERKKLQNAMVQNIPAARSDECGENQLQAKKPKTNAERRKKHYEAQKLKKQLKKIPKTVKQKNKEYYERKKKIRALNTLNLHCDAKARREGGKAGQATSSANAPEVEDTVSSAAALEKIAKSAAEVSVPKTTEIEISTNVTWSSIMSLVQDFHWHLPVLSKSVQPFQRLDKDKFKKKRDNIIL